MDTEIAWEECVDDIPLDTKNLPSLNALSSNSATHLPDIDLLDLFSFDHNSQSTHHPHHHNQSHSPRDELSTHTTNVFQKPRLPTPPSPPMSMHVTDSPVTSASPTTPSSPGGATTSSTQSGRHSCNSSELDTATSDDVTTILAQEKQDDNNKLENTQHQHQQQQQQQTLTDQSQLVLELSTRLASAGAEATALRKRVACLSAENRSLRASLDHANARLLAVAQAATQQPSNANTTANANTPHLMLGLAHVTTDVANRLAGAFTVSDPLQQQQQLQHHLQQQQQQQQQHHPHHTSSSQSCSSDQQHQHQQKQQPSRSNKKRKRVSGAAATTMACVMFMWGALVGSPGWLSSTGNSTSRSQAALPDIWKAGDTPAIHTTDTAVAKVASNSNAQQVNTGSWQPNCMRILEQLPDGNEQQQQQQQQHHNKKSKQEPILVVGGAEHVDSEDEDDMMDVDNQNENEVSTGSEMFVNVLDNKANAKVVATADHHQQKHMDNNLPKYSYVLCRDTQAAMKNVKACTNRMKNGLACGEPHTLSLILPASVAGLDDWESNDTDGNNRRPNHMDLAEVQCSITSVAKIPVGSEDQDQDESDVDVNVNVNVNVNKQSTEPQVNKKNRRKYGRVIATVPETGTAVIG